MNKKYIKLIIRVFITSCLLVWVFSRIDRQQFLQIIPKAKLEYLFLLWLTSTAFLVLNAVKMRYIMKQHSLDIGTFLLFKASAITSLYSLILPGVISTGAKWYILKKSTGKGTMIFNGMIYNQLSENIIICACALIALIFANPTTILIPNIENSWVLPVICSLILFFLILVTLFLLNHRTNKWLLNILNRMTNLLPKKMRDKGRQTVREAAIFQSAGWKFHTLILLFTIGHVLGSIIVYFLAAKAVNLTIPLTVYIWLSSTIFLLGRIPITIANLGLRDITLVSILAAYGLDKPSVLLMSMLLFSTIVIKAILGAGFLIQWSLAEKKV